MTIGTQDIRQLLHTELEQARIEFHLLLSELEETHWFVPSTNPAWTIGEVLYHLVISINLIPPEVRLIKRQLRLPAPPLVLFDRFNVLLTRWGARRFNLQSITAEYDRCHHRLLAALELVKDDEWELGQDYPRAFPPLIGGHTTIKDMFQVPLLHLRTHAQDIREAAGLLQTAQEEPEQPHFEQRMRGPLTYPSGRWERFTMKAPIALFRLGLAPLVGRIMVVISHVGRKSGRTHHTMTEYITLANKIYVPCAFGEKSDWYKNLMTDPLATIQTSAGAASVRAARVTESAELLGVIERFRRREAPLIAWYLDSLSIENTPADILAKKDRIHILRFDPVAGPAPQPLPANLVWVWPALLVSLLVAFITGRRRAG